jgi:hypothetical protein
MPLLSAVILDQREYHGKKFTCIYSIVGFPRQCGPQGYSEVFTGTVRSTVDVGDTDKRLRLVPDEVFVGSPASEVTATTNQACLSPEIKTGDKWLFYLYRDEKTDTLWMGYDGRSKPIAQAHRDIDTLRHLSKLGSSGIVMGRVGLPDHKVVAGRRPNGTEYSVVTDKGGNFELELPTGWYNLTANTERGWWAPEYMTFVGDQSCAEIDFIGHTDGRIAGTVSYDDGRRAAYIQVAVVPLSPKREAFNVTTNGQGQFEVGGQPPGKYEIGVGTVTPTGIPSWQSPVIDVPLGRGEWHTNIDVRLSAAANH